MAARLRRMSAGQLREALGIAEYHGARSQMMREIATPTMLHDGSGWGALAGLSAAILAEEGFTGAAAATVEAPEAARHWDDLGRFWQIEHQYVKPYRSAGGRMPRSTLRASYAFSTSCEPSRLPRSASAASIMPSSSSRPCRTRPRRRSTACPSRSPR